MRSARPLGDSRGPPAWRLLAACLAIAAWVGCGAPGGGGELLTSGSGALRVDPGTAVVFVTIRVATSRPVDALTLSTKPAGVEVSLPWRGTQKTYTTILTLPAMQQTVTVTASSGKNRVATSSIDASLLGGSTAAVALLALDTSGWPMVTSPVAITGLALSPNSTPLGRAVDVRAKATATSGSIAYRWSATCAGAFADASRAETAWTASQAGSCVVTARASTSIGSDAQSGTISVTPSTSSVAIHSVYVPWPTLVEIDLDAQAGACQLLRSGRDATCHVRVRPAEAITVTATADSASGAALAWTDDCGGTFSAPDVSAWPPEATGTWSAPAVTTSAVCTLTPTLTLQEMVDAFPVSLVVAPP